MVVGFRSGDLVVARLGFNGDHLGVGWVLRWRSGLGFNSVSSSSIIWVSVQIGVGVESVGLNWLGLALNRL